MSFSPLSIPTIDELEEVKRRLGILPQQAQQPDTSGIPSLEDIEQTKAILANRINPVGPEGVAPGEVDMPEQEIGPSLSGVARGFGTAVPFYGSTITSPVEEAPAPTYGEMGAGFNTSTLPTGIVQGVGAALAGGFAGTPAGPAGVIGGVFAGSATQDLLQSAKQKRLDQIHQGLPDPGFTGGMAELDTGDVVQAGVMGALAGGGAAVGQVAKVAGLKAIEGGATKLSAAIPMVAKSVGYDVATLPVEAIAVTMNQGLDPTSPEGEAAILRHIKYGLPMVAGGNIAGARMDMPDLNSAVAKRIAGVSGGAPAKTGDAAADAVLAAAARAQQEPATTAAGAEATRAAAGPEAVAPEKPTLDIPEPDRPDMGDTDPERLSPEEIETQSTELAKQIDESIKDGSFSTMDQATEGSHPMVRKKALIKLGLRDAPQDINSMEDLDRELMNHGGYTKAKRDFVINMATRMAKDVGKDPVEFARELLVASGRQGDVKKGAAAPSTLEQRAAGEPLETKPDKYGFYSKASRLIEQKMRAPSKPSQVLAMLKSNGVSDQEILHSGLSEILGGEKTITKEQVREALDEGMLEVNFIQRGGPVETRTEDASRLNMNEAERLADRILGNEDPLAGYRDDEYDYDAEAAGRDEYNPNPLDPKHEQYGAEEIGSGDNYMEVTATMPESKAVRDAKQNLHRRLQQAELARDEARHGERMHWRQGEPVDPSRKPRTDEELERAEIIADRELEAATEEYNRLKIEESDDELTVKSHFDEPNVIGSARTSDRTIGGDKSLLVHELQSDVHQRGHTEGYRAKGEMKAARETQDKLRLETLQAIGKKFEKTTGFTGAIKYFQKWETALQDLIYKDFRDKYKNAANTFMAETKIPKGVDADLVRKWAEATAEKYRVSQKAPDIPFKENWHELLIKRIFDHAAKNGYKKIAFTSGESQVNINQARKQVDSLTYWPETKRIVGTEEGEVVVNKVIKSEQELSKYVGHDAANRLLASDSDASGAKNIQGKDLEIESGFHRNLYDSVIRGYVQKLSKKYGIDVVTEPAKDGGIKGRYEGPVHSISNIRQAAKQLGKMQQFGAVSSNQLTYFANTLDHVKLSGDAYDEFFREMAGKYLSPESAKAIGGKLWLDRKEFDVHSAALPETAAASIKEEGFSLFQKKKRVAGVKAKAGTKAAVKTKAKKAKAGAKVETQKEQGEIKGRVNFNSVTGKKVITLFENADISTIVHELAHIWRREMSNPEDLAKIAKWAGVGEDGKWTVDAEEKFARGFENYLRTGKAPNSALAQAFENIKRWMSEVYHQVAGSEIDIKVPKEIRQIFDRLFTPEEAAALPKPRPEGAVRAFTPDPNAPAMLNQTRGQWFGESEVRDEKGDPLQVYHGRAGEPIERFEAGHGSTTPHVPAWFSEDPAHAGQYAEMAASRADFDSEENIYRNAAPQHIIPAHLSIKKPFYPKGISDMDYVTIDELFKAAGAKVPKKLAAAFGDSEWRVWQWMNWDNLKTNGVSPWREISNFAKENGYDGLGMDEEFRGDIRRTWAPFFAEQAKSSIGNRGTYEGPNLLEQRQKPMDVDEEAIESRIHYGAQPERERKIMGTGVMGVINRFNKAIFTEKTAIDLTAQRAKKAGAIDPRRDPEILRRNMAGGVSSAEEAVTGKGLRDYHTGELVKGKDGKVIGSLESILRSVPKGEDNIFRAYVLARAAVEAEGRDIETGIPIDEAHRVKDKYTHLDPNQKTQHQAAFDRLMEWKAANMKYAEDAGILNDKSRAAMEEAWKEHIPLRRLMEADELPDRLSNFATKRGMSGIRELWKERKGSTREILDPLKVIMDNTHALLDAAEKNHFMTSLTDLATLPGMHELMTPLGGSARPSAVKVMKNGRPTYWQLDPDLREAVSSMAPVARGLFSKLLSPAANILRAGQVLHPAFQIANVFRDSINAAVISKNGLKPFEGVTKAFLTIFSANKRAKYNELYHEYRAAGGDQALESSYLYDYDRAAQITHAKLGMTQGEKLISLTKRGAKSNWNPLEHLQRFAKMSEELTRLGEYSKSRDKALKAGLSKRDAMAKAAYDARNLLDFAEGGSLTKSAKGPAAFFGSQLQGLRRESNAINVFKDPKYAAKTFIKGFIYLTIPTILNFLNNREDPEYMNASQVRRDTMWFVRLPQEMGGHAIWVPKPPGILGYGFTVPIERAMMAHMKGDPDGFKNFWQGMATHIPNPIPTAGRFPFEAVSNYSVYQGRPIVPEHLVSRPAEKQYTPETSITSRKIAGVMKSAKDAAGVKGNIGAHLDSPIMIDYIRDSIFGSLGRSITKGINFGRDEFGMKKGVDVGGIDAIVKMADPDLVAPDEPTRQNQGVLSRFQVDPVRYGDEVLNRFYDKAAYLNTEKEREELGEDSEADTSELKGMDRAKKKITELRKEMEELGDEDEEERKAIRQDIIDIASDWVELPKGATQPPSKKLAGALYKQIGLQ